MPQGLCPGCGRPFHPVDQDDEGEECGICSGYVIHHAEPISQEGFGSREITLTAVCPKCESKEIFFDPTLPSFTGRDNSYYCGECGAWGASGIFYTGLMEDTLMENQCEKCGRSYDGVLCNTCQIFGLEEVPLVTREMGGLGDRKIKERASCPRCGSLSPLYECTTEVSDGPNGPYEEVWMDVIYCYSCDFQGIPDEFHWEPLQENVVEAIASLLEVLEPGSPRADLGDYHPGIQSSHAVDQEERIDDDEEEKIDAVINPDEIPLNRDLFDVEPGSGLPSSVGSIGEMPIR